MYELTREVNLYNASNKRAAFAHFINRLKGYNGTAKIDRAKVRTQLLDPEVERRIAKLERDLKDEKVLEEFESVIGNKNKKS